jgi:2'-5' RNA ligase
MDKLTQKWAIAAFLEPVEDGFEFHRSDIPLHVTLAGVFASEMDGQQLGETLAELLCSVTSFDVEGGEDLFWGENGEITVVQIKESRELKKLYNRIYDKLVSEGTVYNEPHFEGEANVLHSTVQKHDRLENGQKTRIKSVSLVDMFPNSDGYQRKVVKTINLGT